MAEEKATNGIMRDYSEELLKLIRSDLTPAELSAELDNYHESDIAEIIPELNKEERLKLYKTLGNEFVSDIFAHLDNVETYVEELSNENVAGILGEMDADEAADILEELDDDKKSQLLGLMDEETASDIRMLDAYGDDVIGSRMTTNFITINLHYSVKEAMKSVIDQAAENDNISTIYAVDDNEVYYGAISLRDLVITRKETALDTVISTKYPYFYADEDITKCVEELRDYSEDSIPILNRENKIVGVITSSELVDVIGDEMDEDYAKLAGLTNQEDLKEPLFMSIKKRLPWLSILMCLGLIVSSLIGSFSFVITLFPILVCFQSLILDMSGNSGTQSLAVTIRVITSETLTFKEKAAFVFKEMRVGFCNGLLIGILASLLCSLYIYFIVGSNYGITTYAKSLSVSFCIGFSILCAMTTSSITGTLIPITFKKLKIDPAVASGPLITTVNDLIAATVYYGLSYIFLADIFGI